jgi:alpha-glucan,water dikinase
MTATAEATRTEWRPLGNGLFVAEGYDNTASPTGNGDSNGDADGAPTVLTLRVRTDAECVLHWGVRGGPGQPWVRPPEDCRPAGTVATDGAAVRTPFRPDAASDADGWRSVRLPLGRAWPGRQIAFVLNYPADDRWVKAPSGGDFSVDLPGSAVARPPRQPRPVRPTIRRAGDGSPPRSHAAVQKPAEPFSDAWAFEGAATRRSWNLDGAAGAGRLAAGVTAEGDSVRVRLVCESASPVLLHWGVAGADRSQWRLPAEPDRPEGTVPFDGKAARTPLKADGSVQRLEIRLRKGGYGEPQRGINFVLFRPADGAWLKSGGRDLQLPLSEPPAAAAAGTMSSAAVEELTNRIIDAETKSSSWTLMHRFNLACDLLDGAAAGDPDAMATVYAWLRYSATRQLDWQRRYNTKPRDLAHAQDRLTGRLAEVWLSSRGDSSGAAECRRYARLALGTLGRGADGQRVRDGILEIMHRNHIKETAGHFIEEWHQKLHNNTTPDDVVICEGYLAFLRSGGDRGRFYDTLAENGVTRERLRGFERPIKTDPEFFADKRDALIGEFEWFLRILKAVHSGTDLESAAGAAKGRLDAAANGRVGEVLGMRHGDPDPVRVADAVADARGDLWAALEGAGDPSAARDLLFLDLALEDFLRRAVERQPLSKFDRGHLADLTAAVLRNLAVDAASSGGDAAAEADAVAAHWEKLLSVTPTGKDAEAARHWSLHAKGVADRAARAVQTDADALYRRLQPRAERLGAGFGTDKAVVALFSEEVVRGRPGFVLSLLLRRLDPLLRKSAGLGGWQVISPAAAAGKVRTAEKLIAVQGERFAEPTVLIADTVGGNEEIPEGVTAVITADTPDLVSHVSVRARNAGVLFATCYDRDEYTRLKERLGRTLSLKVTPRGDVEIAEGSPAAANGGGNGHTPAPAGKSPTRRPERGVTDWVLTADRFRPGLVGGKSNNLNGLRGRLPDWIGFPASLALPFGAAERTLSDEANRDLRRRYLELLDGVEKDREAVLGKVRTLLLDLKPPAGLREALAEAWKATGLPETPWDKTWRGICRVWASKWNDRAYLSRRARGVAHEDLLMAVLIQQVIPAEYAFVIHTVNPFTGDAGELYAEVVPGLGETLVGAYPGRAMGFSCRKSDLKLTVLSYPGKSVALDGRGVIFRSDSNGEDLEGFAGAGLYESVLADEPIHRVLDYASERLVWDAAFRDELLRSVARAGLEVEKTLGSPQDIEGAIAGGKLSVVQTRPQVGLKS